MQSTNITDLESWIKICSEIRPNKSFTAPRFLKPYHLATLVQKLQSYELADLCLPPKISSYANAMALWQALGLNPPVIIRSHPTGRYHPITSLKEPNEIETVSESLILFFKGVCSDDKTLNAVRTMLKELIDNCFSHSALQDGKSGVICAQVWPGGRKAQVAISDSGVGIRQSLTGNPDYIGKLTTLNSCEFATQYGVTGKPANGHSGYGLALARGLLEQNRGSLFVRSADECFILASRKTSSLKGQEYLNGTLLVIELNLDIKMDISKVYEDWPQIDGMTDDDFDI